MLTEQLVKYVMYGIIIAFLFRLTPLREIFKHLPRAHRRFLTLMFGLILFAQVVESKYETYPFVKWGMYSSAGAKVTYYEYQGVRANGDIESFPLARLLRIYAPACPTCSKRLVWRLRDLARKRLKENSDLERAEATDLYERTLQAAWAQYASRNPSVKYDAIEVWQSHFAVSDYRDTSSIEREFLWRVPLVQGRADAK